MTLPRLLRMPYGRSVSATGHLSDRAHFCLRAWARLRCELGLALRMGEGLAI